MKFRTLANKKINDIMLVRNNPPSEFIFRMKLKNRKINKINTVSDFMNLKLKKKTFLLIKETASMIIVIMAFVSYLVFCSMIGIGLSIIQG